MKVTQAQVRDEWGTLAKGLSERCRLLRPIIVTVGGPTLEINRNPYRALAESILSQQLAGSAARSIIGKFRQLESPYPRPESVIRWRVEKLRGAGVSAQKAGYLKALSERFLDKRWRRGWDRLEDAELIARLTEVKGIGEWTAQMFLMFSQGRPNVLPTLDYGVRKGAQLLFSLKELPTPKELPGLVKHWEGAYSVGSWYLWRALDQKLIGA